MQRVDIVKTNLAFGNLQERGYTDMIVIHHTGNPTDDDMSAAELHQSHIVTQGWAGIGYHFVIRKDGTVEEGRPVWAVGSHAYGQNSHTIGIHVCGNFEIGSPTAAQIEKTAMLIATLCADYNLPIDRNHIVGHRELMATACPGRNLFAALDTIVGKANWYAHGAQQEPKTAQNGSSVDLRTNDAKIWFFLKGKGLNDFAAAGIMGNLYAESGLEPTNLENYYERQFGMSDAEYTAAVDNGSYGNFVYDKAGYGLAQWTYYSRKENLLNFARLNGVSIGNLDMQLNFLWSEFEQGYSTMLNKLLSAKSVFEASNAVLFDFERPADQSEQVQQKRASFGQDFYDKFATAKQESEEEVMRYDDFADLPDWAKPTVQNWLDCGAIKGDGMTLDLSSDMLRLIVMLERRLAAQGK